MQVILYQSDEYKGGEDRRSSSEFAKTLLQVAISNCRNCLPVLNEDITLSTILSTITNSSKNL